MSGDPSKPDTVRFTMKEYGNAVALTEGMVANYLIDPSPMVEIMRNMQASIMNPPVRDEAARARDAAWQLQREIDRDKRDQAATERWANTRNRLAEPVLREIADLHKPTTGEWYTRTECEGCRAEVSGYEYDMEEWPCATFALIEEAL